jgi:hypothetical protein
MKITESLNTNELSLVNLGLSTTGHTLKKYLLISIAGILALSDPGIAKAQFSITASIGGLPTVSGATLETFDEPSPSILSLSGSASLGTGANYGVIYIPPCFSGSQAAFFGEPTTLVGDNNYTWDDSQYVAVWDDGSATLSFSTPQNYLGLLWGTIGAGDSLTFYDSANNVIGTVLGENVPIVPSGDWGPNDTAYVNITSTTAFSRVVATETATPSFEFDDVTYAIVPEPGSCVLFGAGFCILGFVLRRKSA